MGLEIRDGRFSPAVTTHARRFDDEVVLLDLNGGDYYALNAQAAVIWEGLVAERSPAEVARDLCDAYEVAFDQALNDCIALVNELCARGLLERKS